MELSIKLLVMVILAVIVAFILLVFIFRVGGGEAKGALEKFLEGLRDLFFKMPSK